MRFEFISKNLSKHFWPKAESTVAGDTRKATVITPQVGVMVFGPGIFFLAIGICALLAPQLVVAVLAALFLFLGGLMCAIAWKFIQLKKRFEKACKNFEARVYFEKPAPRRFEFVETDAELVEEIGKKKVTYH